MSVVDSIQAILTILLFAFIIWWMLRPSVVQLKAPAKDHQRYVCVRHFPVTITYACKGQHGLFAPANPEEHTHTLIQLHHSPSFQRDDIADQELITQCRGISIGEEERRYYTEDHARLIQFQGRTMVVCDGKDQNSFFAGIATSHDDAMCFVVTGDASRLTKPWEAKP